VLNPVAAIIDKSLEYLRHKDPSWENAQPAEFKLRVVESWKNQITPRVVSNTLIQWELALGDQTFAYAAPLFCQLDWNYNPYLLGFDSPFPLRKI